MFFVKFKAEGFAVAHREDGGVSSSDYIPAFAQELPLREFDMFTQLGANLLMDEFTFHV
jgi:hypothetical protein